MKFYLLIALATLSVCLIATLAHATPKQGVEYTYETIKHSHDIIRHPDEVIIPPDPQNDDCQAYEHWRWLHPFISNYKPKEK